MELKRGWVAVLLVSLLSLWALVPTAVGQTVLTGWTHPGIMNPGGGLDVMLEVIIPAFERQHPGVKVEWHIFGSDSAMREQLALAVAGGVGPDLFIDGTNLIGARVVNGIVAPLDDYVARWAGAGEILAARSGDYQGRTYAIPFENKAAPLAYRIDHFLEAGLDADQPPQSWAEYLDYTRKLNRVQGDQVTRMGSQIPDSANSHVRTFNVLLQMNGGNLLNEDLSQPAFNNDLGRETLTWMAELSQAVAGPRVSYSLPGSNFGAGNVSMSFRENVLPRRLGNNQDAWDATGVALPLQKGDGKNIRIAWGGVVGASISSTSMQKDLAWEFIEFMMQTEYQVALHSAEDSFPAIRSALLDPRWSENRIMRGMAEAVPYLLDISQGEGAPEYDIVRGDIGRLMISVLAGDLAVNAALEQAEQIWQVEIDRN